MQSQGHGSVYRGVDDDEVQPRAAANPYPVVASDRVKNNRGRPPKPKQYAAQTSVGPGNISSYSCLDGALGDSVGTTSESEYANPGRYPPSYTYPATIHLSPAPQPATATACYPPQQPWGVDNAAPIPSSARDPDATDWHRQPVLDPPSTHNLPGSELSGADFVDFWLIGELLMARLDQVDDMDLRYSMRDFGHHIPVEDTLIQVTPRKRAMTNLVFAIADQVFQEYAQPFLPPTASLSTESEILKGFDSLVHAVIPVEQWTAARARFAKKCPGFALMAESPSPIDPTLFEICEASPATNKIILHFANSLLHTVLLRVLLSFPTHLTSQMTTINPQALLIPLQGLFKSYINWVASTRMPRPLAYQAFVQRELSGNRSNTSAPLFGFASSADAERLRQICESAVEKRARSDKALLEHVCENTDELGSILSILEGLLGEFKANQRLGPGSDIMRELSITRYYSAHHLSLIKINRGNNC